MSIEQCSAEKFFQALDLPTQRWLRQAQIVRRSAKAAAVCYRGKRPEMMEIE
jgi:hypothetical protein